MKCEKVTLTKRSRRTPTQSALSKEIMVETAKDYFDIINNSENEIERTGGLQDHEETVLNNFTTNNQKANEISESSSTDMLNADSQVGNEESSSKIYTEELYDKKQRRSKSMSSYINIEDCSNNKQNDENIILPQDNVDNTSECRPINTPKTEKVSSFKKGRKGRRLKFTLSKDHITRENNGKDESGYDVSKKISLKDSILPNHIITSAEIHEHQENVRTSEVLDEKSTCNPVEFSEADQKAENFSAQNSLKIKSQSVKIGKREKHPKSSRIDINNKETEVVESDSIASILKHNFDLQEDNITQIEETSKSSSAENPIHSKIEIDTFIGDDNVIHDSGLETRGIDEKTNKNSAKSIPKSLNIQIGPCESNNEKKKQQCKRSKIKYNVMDNGDELKYIGKDSSITSIRKSGRRQKSNVNYCVPDEDVDFYDSERRVTKDSIENAPKKRRGRPSKKTLLMKLNASTEENLEPQESIKNDTTLDDTVNNLNAATTDISNIPTRERRAANSNNIDEDIFDTESKSVKQEESFDIPDQSQVKTLSDATGDINDFEDSLVSGKYEEEDVFEEPKSRRGRKRKDSFNVHATKRRGRPSVQKEESNDDDYTPHHSYVSRSTKVKEKCKETPGKKIVKCGKCGKEVPKNQWYSHNLYSHNDMGWLDGTEKPDFDSDPKLLMRVLTLAHKKKHKKGLTCEECREVKKSVVGFISHMRFCGKTDEEIASLLVTCDQCGSKFKPSSMEYHERQHRLEIEGKKKREKEMMETIIDISEPRSKRKAAEKAVSKISEFTALVKDDDGRSVAKKLKLSSPHIKKFIQKPLATKKISSVLITKWKRELDNNQDASCTQLGCQFTCKSMDEIRKHYSLCNFTATENYVCKVCRFQTLLEDEIIKHAAEKHTPEDLDINAAMSDADASDSEDYSDLDEDSSNKSQGLVKKFFYKESSDVENKMFKFIFNNGACHTVLNKTFLTGFQWTLEFERKHFKFSIFNDFMPNVFTLMKEKDAKSYLPELDSSLPVRFIKKNGDLNDSEWKNWSRFESDCVDDCPTFFVGGPIWAMAWAPTPNYLAISDNLSQYLAISTHPTMDIEYSVGKSYSGKNIIQIWNVGKLNNNRNASERDPELSYAISHDGGTVWSLEWCPSGCYQHKDFPDLKNKNDSNRLGLLAAGCSDGCIRIYSLVFPQDLHYTPNENQCPIYKTEPVMQLIVSSDMYENNEQNWQVMKLSWSRESNHNVIVAGLSNGYVAFWDLTTESPMLKYKVNNTTFLRPYRQFFAHHHAVTMVALVSQDNKRYLATASLDKLYKFWDLEDISKPKNTYKKSYVTDGAWFNNWCCAIIVHDNALCSSGNNSAVCLPLRNYTYKYYNILPSNSTVYGLSISDFGNSVATGNVAGELLALFPHQLVYIRDMEKTIPPKRSQSIVSTIKLVDFKIEEVINTVKKGKKGKNESYSDPTQYMPSTYKDSKDRFGIMFNNKIDPLQSRSKKVQKYKKKPTLTCEHLEQTPIEQYPLKSINKVAWNPNASSFLWLAVGYQSGFVRLISFRSVASTAEWNKLLQSHTNILKAQMAQSAAEDSC
ncbi:uncharacterized protein LOC131670594 [Phymastichus coffea]|uniref:uncharacterized protein LOC131670594 n=1 Tax=Phymastichus coffea TaxID=108790 RepID=UPI00273B85CF|nr:uncharacterized protein LOC131670594 [Phymastichus coffea]